MDFFKKVSDGVSQKATDVSATMRLNSQIKSNEEELRKTLQSLGETYYNNAKEGTEGDYTALIAQVDELKGESRVYFVGDGVPVYQEEIKRVMGERAVFAPLSCNAQRASCVAAAAMRYAKEGKIMHYSELLPVYLRKPQAERELEEKQKGDL